MKLQEPTYWKSITTGKWVREIQNRLNTTQNG